MAIRSLLKKIKRKFFPKKKKKFSGSKNYWERRYANNRNSGAGSYGRLAQFKADVINDFVVEHEVKTVVELGSGDGNQLSLANYPHYRGYDVSKTAVELCNEKFKNDPNKEFYWLAKENATIKSADVALSLDVIYHLIEDAIYDSYMSQLFEASHQFVIIYASNHEEIIASHVKSRKFTTWVDANVGDSWKLLKKIDNDFPFDPENPDHTSISDFYIYEKK